MTTCDINQAASRSALFSQRLQMTAAGSGGLLAGVEAMLDEIVRLSAIDPRLPRFLGTAAADQSRRPSELREANGLLWMKLDELSRELVGRAAAAGELDTGEDELLAGIISTMCLGLMTVGSFGAQTQARAAEGLKQLLQGTLIKPARLAKSSAPADSVVGLRRGLQ